MTLETIPEIDLVYLIESHLGAGESTGKWTKFNCPFCRYIRRDSKKYLLVTNEGERSWFVCKFCGKRGDALTWMKEYRHLGTLDALEALRFGKNPNVRYRNSIEAIPASG